MDHYQTSIYKRRSLCDRLFRPGNLYFYLSIVNILRKAAAKAKAGLLDNQAQKLLSRDVMGAIENCSGNFHITGLGYVTNEPMVVISNHMSALETLVLPWILTPKPLSFVVKKSLFTYPIFGDILRAMGCIPVTRKNAAQDLRAVFTEGTDKLETGRSVVVFPQQTRTVEFNPDDFNTIGIKLARETGANILPLTLRTDFWGRGRIISDYGPINRKLPICFAIGKPIKVEQGFEKEAHRQVIDFIERKLAIWT